MMKQAALHVSQSPARLLISDMCHFLCQVEQTPSIPAHSMMKSRASHSAQFALLLTLKHL